MTRVGAGPGVANSTGHPGGRGGAAPGPAAADVNAPGGGGTGPGSSWAAAGDRQVAARHRPADSVNPHRIRIIRIRQGYRRLQATEELPPPGIMGSNFVTLIA